MYKSTLWHACVHMIENKIKPLADLKLLWLFLNQLEFWHLSDKKVVSLLGWGGTLLTHWCSFELIGVLLVWQGSLNSVSCVGKYQGGSLRYVEKQGYLIDLYCDLNTWNHPGGHEDILQRHSRVWLSEYWINELQRKENFPKKIHAGRRKRCHQRGTLSPEKRFHTVLTTPQTTLQKETEAQTVWVSGEQY